MKRVLLTGLFFCLLRGVFCAPASALTFSVTEIKLDRMLEATREPVSVNAGDVIRFQFGAVASEPMPFRRLAVWDGQRRIQLPDHEEVYSSFARVTFGYVTYWVVEGFSGGAHCCTTYHIFVRPGSGQPLTMLGDVGGYNVSDR